MLRVWKLALAFYAVMVLLCSPAEVFGLGEKVQSINDVTSAVEARWGQASLRGPHNQLIAKVWDRCLHLFEAHKYADLLVELDSLTRVRANLAMDNAVTLSKVLFKMAMQLGRKGEQEKKVAVKLANHAVRLSPKSAEVMFEYSNVMFRLNRTAIGAYTSAFLRGLTLLGQDKLTFSAIKAGFFALLALLIIALTALFTFALLVRYLELPAHDLSHLLPKDVGATIVLGFTILVLLTPLFLGLGLLEVFATVIFVTWLYQNNSERIVSGLSLVLMYCLPLLNTAYVNALQYLASDNTVVQECISDLCQGTFHTRLDNAVQEGDYSGGKLYALAQLRLRESMTNPEAVDEAFRLFNQGRKNATGDEQKLFLAGLGDVKLAKGIQRCARAGGHKRAGVDDWRMAKKWYESALQIDSGLWQVRYNLSKVLQLLGEEEHAAKNRALAEKAAPLDVIAIEKQSLWDIENMPCPTNFSITRDLAGLRPNLPPPKTSEYAKKHLAILHPALLGVGQHWTLSLFVTLVLLACIGLLFVHKYIKPSVRCIKCNGISCLRCRSELAGTGLCEECAFYKIRGSFVDPKESWMREKRIDMKKRNRARLEALISFLLPGLGHLLRGQAVKGFIFALLFFGSTASLFLSQLHYEKTAVIPSFSGTNIVAIVALTLVASVSYLFNLIDIYSRR